MENNSNQISAKYELPGRGVYEYQVTWFASGDGVFWHASIACDNKLKGRPWGAVSGHKNRDVRAAVIAAVQQSIENLHGVYDMANSQS